MEYKSNNNVVYSCKYHVVWCPKYRRKVLTGEIASEIEGGRSSSLLRKEFKSLTTKLPTLWTNAYFISTVGGAPLSIIKQYIENQKTSERK
jgi:putative transposase